jgi:hypothetical protein
MMRINQTAAVLFTCVVTGEAPCVMYCDVINIGLVAIAWKGDIGHVGLVSHMEGEYWQCKVSKKHSIVACSIGFSQ